MAFDVTKMNTLNDEYLRLSKKFAELKALASINVGLLLLVVDTEKYPEAKEELDKVKKLVQALISESERIVFDFDKSTLKQEAYGVDTHRISEEVDYGVKDEESLDEILLVSDAKNILSRQISGDENATLNGIFQWNDSVQAVGTSATHTVNTAIISGGVKKVDVLHECCDCGKEFKTKNSLNLHRRTHKEGCKKDDIQICDACGKQCKSKIAMLSHQRIHENTNIVHTCTKCNKEFHHKWQYNRHLHLHASEKSFICDSCGKTFKTASNLRCHIALIHMKKYQQNCKLCGKTFSRMSNLTRHLRSHYGEKPFQCSICDKAFAKIDSCKSHEKRHFGNYAHPCPNCGKGFDFISQLHFHQRRFHSAGLPCSCSVCGKTFASNAEALSDKNCQDPTGVHKLVCGEVKRYKCVLCTAGFSQKVPFALHLLSAHIRELDHCLLCDNEKTFTSSQDLELHLTNVHLKARQKKKDKSLPVLLRPTDAEQLLVPIG